MNKYQKAFNNLSAISGQVSASPFVYRDNLEIINELINKSVKIRPILKNGYCCRICGSPNLDFIITKNSKPNFCPNCGQAIDWS